jgi:hypothetical protein
LRHGRKGKQIWNKRRRRQVKRDRGTWKKGR